MVAAAGLNGASLWVAWYDPLQDATVTVLPYAGAVVAIRRYLIVFSRLLIVGVARRRPWSACGPV
jgi:hypothetical protein